MKRRLARRWQWAREMAVIAGILAWLAACRPTSSPTSESAGAADLAAAPGRALVFGLVSPEATEELVRWRPLIDHLAAEIRHVGVNRGEIRIHQDFGTMARSLSAGDVDFYLDSFFPATLVTEQTGIEPSLLRLKDPPAKHVVFLARAEAGLTALGDLRGRVIALEEYESTSGFMVPLAYLLQAGLTPVRKAGPGDPVAPDEVGYVFSVGDVNTIQWVISRKVDAGATDSLYYERISPETRKALVVLHETATFTRHQLVLIRRDLDPAVASALVAALTGLDESPVGRALLADLGDAGFAEITPEDRARLSQLERLFRQVRDGASSP